MSCFPICIYISKEVTSVVLGAVCLDGSPPAYQLDKGSGDGVNSWLMFIQVGLSNRDFLFSVIQTQKNFEKSICIDV